MEAQSSSFDNTKNYEWTPEDVFTLKGPEFGKTLNFMLEREAILLKELEIINIFKTKLMEAVESGVAKEVVLSDRS